MIKPENFECKKCRRNFPFTDDFYFRDKYRKFGLKTMCKECESGKEYFNKSYGLFNIKWKNLKCKSGIYKITNKNTGKFYIGSAVDICARWCSHLCELNKGTHGNPFLQNSYNKHGFEAFEFSIVEIVEDKTMILEREQFWLDKTQSYERKNGYNILRIAGNCLGKVTSEETKEKLRRINNKPVIQLDLKGNFIAEWISANEAERISGYTSSNISICVNKKRKKYKGFLWISKEEYENDKFDIASIIPIKRTILQYTRDGQFIKEWTGTVTSIADAIGAKQSSNISQVCLGKQPTASGYVWRFRYGDEEIKKLL